MISFRLPLKYFSRFKYLELNSLLNSFADYYDHALGGLVIEAHVHGLPTPSVKFYRDGHLIHARRNKVVFFVEDKEIFQCLLVRPDASVSGTYTVLAENKAGKKRFDHHVDFVTKCPLIHLPGMRHADKKLEDFVEQMLEKIPKVVEKPAEPTADEKLVEAEAVAAAPEELKAEVRETPKAEEIVEALQAVVEGGASKAEEEKPKKHHHHKSKSKHRSKKASSPKIDADLLNDGEDEPEAEFEPVGANLEKRKFSTVVHEPYESETFRIYNSKNNLWFSGKLRDQTAIEGTTVKMICAATGPTPMLKWMKNGKPVPWSATVRNMSGEGIGHVILEKIARSDAGVYTCHAKNQWNEVTTEAVIKVIQRSTVPTTDTSKPMFTRVLGEFYRNTEDDLILDAHVRAVLAPKVSWFKDGVEINAAIDSRFDFTTDHDGGYQLRIHKPKPEDSGLYGCEAVNSEGKAKVTHKVNFTELERHTHPQFLYHKESFWQPTLRMEISPEPVKEVSPPPPEIAQAAGTSGGRSVNIQASQDSGSSENQDSSGVGESSDGAQGGSGTGGDGNEDGDESGDKPKGPADAAEETEEEEKKEKKPERKPKSSRRKRYEGPIEPLLIRDSVRNSLKIIELI